MRTRRSASMLSVHGCGQFILDSPARLECFPCRRFKQLALERRIYQEEIRKANGDFLAEVKYLKEKAPDIDLVLFPVDRRWEKII